MGDGIIKKFKDWISDEEYDDIEEYNAITEDDTYDYSVPTSRTSSKIVNLHTAPQMKVVIIEPKTYDDAALIADNLKQKRSVIVNLDSINNVETRKEVFNFMNGAIYILEGSIQKVAKSIFILAPNNVEVDANIKKELESKTFFPWQTR
ncbi:MAG: cell division protein SepF [Clostridioides sp.]|jgi:cell division inhibitor SepF|nr:cell division protein SepF [Clostridioides sp.]